MTQTTKGLKMKFGIVNIDFDTDGQKRLANRLKKQWVGKVFEFEDADEASDFCADLISDACGYCVNDVELKKIS
jgi:hypothetical protein